MRIRDGQLTYSRVGSSFTYFFKEKFPKLLDEAETTESLRNSEMFYIGFWNSLTALEGVILKQRAQVSKLQLECAELRAGLGHDTDEQVEEARRAHEQAQGAYRSFLTNTGWFD